MKLLDGSCPSWCSQTVPSKSVAAYGGSIEEVPTPVVSVGCSAARDVFAEAVVEKFEFKYVKSTRVDELYVRAPVILGTMDRTTFWLSISFSCDLDSVPVKSSCNVPLALEATACKPVPTVTADGFHRVSIVML